MHPYVQIKIKIFQVFFLIQMSKGERQGWANRRGNTSDSEYLRLYANAPENMRFLGNIKKSKGLNCLIVNIRLK